MADIDNFLPPNFPQPPSARGISLVTHPRDLIVDDRNFYTQIQFIEYTGVALPDIIRDYLPEGFKKTFGIADRSNSLVNDLITGGPLSGSAAPVGGVVLPIPRRLNDTQLITWTDQGIAHELASAATKLASTGLSGPNGVLTGRRNDYFQAFAAAGSTVSALSGYQLNPVMWMMFKNPEFKVFQFDWQFTAYNEEESYDIAYIINYFKYMSLPKTNFFGAVYEYPSIALIKFFPNNLFTFRLKPCAILSVTADYTGAGMPSFFDNGAPTVINFSIVAKEIDLWTKNNYLK